MITAYSQWIIFFVFSISALVSRFRHPQYYGNILRTLNWNFGITVMNEWSFLYLSCWSIKMFKFYIFRYFDFSHKYCRFQFIYSRDIRYIWKKTCIRWYFSVVYIFILYYTTYRMRVIILIFLYKRTCSSTVKIINLVNIQTIVSNNWSQKIQTFLQQILYSSRV